MTIDIENQAKRFLEKDALRVLEREGNSFGDSALPKNRFLKKMLRSDPKFVLFKSL